MSVETENTLRKLITDVVPQSTKEIELDDDLVRELGLDSLAGLRLLAAVEKKFGIRFPDDRLGEFRTLRQLLDVVSRGEGRGQ